MRRSRFFLVLAVIFGLAYGVTIVTTMGMPGRTAAAAVSLTAVLAGISLILTVLWGGTEDRFENCFDVKPPMWRLRRASASRTMAVVQYIVGAELGKRAEALEQALRQKRKAELECGDAAKEIKWPPLCHDESAKIEKIAAALLNLSKAQRKSADAKAAYSRAAKLANRFGLRACRSYQDYLPRCEFPAEPVQRIPL